MGKMGHAAVHAGNREDKFKSGKAQHHYRSAQGKYAPDINNRIGKKHRVSKFHGEKRPGRAHKDDSISAGNIIHHKGKHPRQDSGQEIIKQKFTAAHLPFYLGSKNKKPKHIENDVAEIAVHEHIRNNSPDPSIHNHHGYH